MIEKLATGFVRVVLLFFGWTIRAKMVESIRRGKEEDRHDVPR